MLSFKVLVVTLSSVYGVLEPWWIQLYKHNFDSQPRVATDTYPTKFLKSHKEIVLMQKDSVQVFEAIKLMEKDSVEKAAVILLDVAERNSFSVSNCSEWYLALCYLKLGQIEFAEHMFYVVAEKEVHPYQNESEVVYQYILKKH